MDSVYAHSSVFVFTDASPKDYHLKAEVIRKAVAAAVPVSPFVPPDAVPVRGPGRSVEVTFLLTGKCGLSAEIENTYDDIARATNGHAYHVPAKDIPVIVKKIAQNQFSGNQVRGWETLPVARLGSPRWASSNH